MAITLTPTPGASDANTYATLAEALTYNAQRPQGSAWAAAATDDVRAAALIWACILLDQSFIWTGVATTPGVQALCWPRAGMFDRNGAVISPAIIPQTIKNVQSEWARVLLGSDLAASNAAVQFGLKLLKTGPIELEFKLPGDGSNAIDLRQADVRLQEPAFAWLSKAVPQIIPAMLVQSWWTRDTIMEPLIFGGGV